MPTEFRFENVFRAPSTATLLAAYFDPDHLATQDKVAQLEGRVVVRDDDSPSTRTASWRVRAIRTLPVYVRPFVGSTLSYLETMVWRRADDEIDLTVIPEIMGGRVQITATYQLREIAAGQIQRRYTGRVSVEASLLSRKIERGIVGEIEAGMPAMTDCTQRWLERGTVELATTRSVATET